MLLRDLNLESATDGELYNRFNNSDAISKYSYDNKYGIILPYKDKFLYNTIYHNLSYRDYVMENIR